MTDKFDLVNFPADIINDFHGPLPSWWSKSIPLLAKKTCIVYDAFLSSSNINGWPHSLISSVNSTIGEEIVESQFMRTGKINSPPLDYSNQKKHAIKLKGEYTYLGWLITHYGHFITESLSRFWYLLENDTPKKYIVHANYKNFNSLPSYVIEILATFGINENNLIILNSPVIVDKLHCPIQSLRCDYGVGYHTKNVYQHIASSLLIKNPGIINKSKSDRIYLSRKSLTSDSRQFNEKAVSEVFENLGFTIYSPEKMTLSEQLEVYYSANYIAGPVGSALHNAAFMNSPGKTLIISPNNFLFKNDCLISIASKHDLSYHLIDNGSADKVMHKTWHVDTKQLEIAVGNWLSM